MADNFSTATLGLGVDVKQFNKDIGNVGTRTEKILANMKLNADAFSEKWGDLTSGIKDTKRIVSGILVSQGFYALSQTLVNSSAAALDFAKNMETAAISMEYFVQGADKAAKAQAYLRTMNTFAAKTPFSTEEALSLSKYMQAVGVSMNTTKSFLSVITDTASATGATDENLQRIVFGLGQMMTKGRLANEEIRQLANANIPIYEILQEQLGLTGKEISKIGNYWIDADSAVVAILRGLEERYEGAADRVAQTVTGMTDTIKDDSKILAQIAGSGIYNAVADKMTMVRDALDRYRDIATTEGSMGLFDTILRDIDASGKLGTEFLALIGNTRQLSAALQSVLIAGQPLISLFGKSIYASVTVAEMTLVGFSKIVNVVLEALDDLGITSGEVAEILSALFITYKVAGWMSLLGQAATSGAYALYTMANSASMILPASIRASAGLKLLTMSIAGALTYGLALFGVLGMINNASAGLDTSKKMGSIFPSDYQSKMDAYSAAMDEYNEKIAKYQESFETPYSTIDDGSTKAVDGLEAVAAASKKASKSVKSDWLAAFDEVFAIPDLSGNDDGGPDSGAPVLPDLGASLIPPYFNFPDMDAIELEMPEFPWSDVFDTGMNDSDVLDGEWWKTLLPIVLLAPAKFLADTWSKNKAADDAMRNGLSGGNNGGGGGTSSTSAFQGLKDANNFLKIMAKKMEMMEAGISEILANIEKAPTKENFFILQERTAEGIKGLQALNRQSILAGKTGDITSNTISAARDILDTYKLRETVDSLNSLLKHRTDTGFDGDTIRKQIGSLIKEAQKIVAEFTIRNGSVTDEIQKLAEGVVNIAGLEGRVDAVKTQLQAVYKAIAKNNYVTLSQVGKITELNKLLNGVINEYAALGMDISTLSRTTAATDNIVELLKTQQKYLDTKAELTSIESILKSADARIADGLVVNKTALAQDAAKLQKALRPLIESIESRLSIIGARPRGGKDPMTSFVEAVAKYTETLSKTTNAKYDKMQQTIEANRKFSNAMAGSIEKYLRAALVPMKALEIYPEKMMLAQSEGLVRIADGINSATDLLSRFKTDELKALKDFAGEIIAAYEEAKTSKSATPGLFTAFEVKAINAIRDVGIAIGAETSLIENYIEDFKSQQMKGISASYPEIDYIIEAVKKAGTKKSIKDPGAERSIVDVLDDKLAVIGQEVHDIAAFDKAALQAFKQVATSYPSQFAKTESQLINQVEVTRAEVVERLDKQLAFQKAFERGIATHVSSGKMVAALLRRVGDLAPLTKERLGDGTRRGWANAAEYAPEAIKRAGLFDPGRVAASGGDIAGLVSGQSGYGVSVQSAAISNIAASVRTLRGLPEQTDTIISIANKAFGRIAELPILVNASEKLVDLGYKLISGDTFFSLDRKTQVQLDGVLMKGSRFSAPIDAKALSSFDKNWRKLLTDVATHLIEVDSEVEKGTTKLVDANTSLMKIAADARGLYTISAKNFPKVIDLSSDIAYQLAAQSYVMGSNTAWLALLDTKMAGIKGPTYSKVAGLDPSVHKDLKRIEALFEKEAAEQYYTRTATDAIKNNTYLVKVSIPEYARQIVKQQSAMFVTFQDIASQLVELGADAREVLSAINKLGDTIGELGASRYIGKEFIIPESGNAALDSTFRDIQMLLNSGIGVLQDIGFAKLENIKTLLLHAADNGEQVIDLGKTIVGQQAKMMVNDSAWYGDFATLISDFQNTFEKRPVALTITLGDKVAQMNEAATTNRLLTDILYVTKANKPFTVEDLAWSIIATDKQLNGPGGSELSKQMLSILSGKSAMQVDNPYGFADLTTAVNILSQRLLAAPKEGDKLQPGQSVNFVKTAEEIAEAYAKAYEQAGWRRYTGYGSVSNQNTGTYSNGPEGRWFGAGRYASYEYNARGAAEGATPISEGYWGKVFGKSFSISTAELSKAANGILIAATVIQQAYSSYKISEAFDQYVIPSLAASDQNAARERGSNFVLPGFDTGIFGGSTATEFFDQYSDMTSQERVFWGNYLSDQKSGFNMLGKSNADVLKDALKNVNSNIGDNFDLGLDYLNMSNEELLRTAMNQGVGSSSLAMLTDYIITSGDTDSKIAREWYKKFGDYMDTVVKPAYGVDNSWMGAVEELLQNKNVTDQLSANGYDVPESAAAMSTNFIPIFSKIIEDLQNESEARVLRELNIAGVYNSDTANPMQGDYTRVIEGELGGLGEAAAKQLKDVLGITITDLTQGLGKISIDAETIADNILGWTANIPDTISLDGTTISVQDAEILAQAGIQINGDGTVTFMKAMNNNPTGTERTVELTVSDVSKELLDKLGKVGVAFDFTGAEASLDLSLGNVAKNMSSALFRFSQDLTGQISPSMEKALSGLGKVMDSGYFEITNKAVLNGSMTVSEYIAGMGSAANKLSPEVLEVLKNIDSVIAQGGEASRETIAEWADGVVMPSPINEDDLTDEIKAAFAAIGITFETSGDEFLMVVNRVGNQLADGMTLIPAETWNKLNEDVRAGLQQMGVSMIEEAGFVKVDISDALGGMFDAADITPAWATAMSELGLYLVNEGGKIVVKSAETGLAIADGMMALPKAIYDKLTPATIQALEDMHIGIVTKGSEVMLNFNNLMSGGVANVISLFANRPDLWDQIPQQIVDTLAAGGVAVENGMIEINTKMLGGLVNIDTQWYGYWGELDQDIVDAMGASKIATEDGLMVLEKVTEDTSIPDDVNSYIVKPFSELPKEIQDYLTGGDSSVKASLEGSQFLITAATQSAFVGAIQATHDSFGAINSEAAAGAAQLAATIAAAITEANKLSNITVKKSWLPQDDNSTAVIFGGIPGNYSVTYMGKTYKGINERTKQMAARAVEKAYGIQIPGYMSGGIIDTDGLYRAGELGATEAIIPLENRSSLGIIGSAIASQMDTAVPTTVLAFIGSFADTALEQINTALETVTTANAVAIYEGSNLVLDAVTTLQIVEGNGFDAINDTLADSTTSILEKLESINLSQSTDAIVTGGDYEVDTNEIIANAQAAWWSADTQAERDAAHAIAEAERANYGYSGGPDGSDYILLTEATTEVAGAVESTNGLISTLTNVLSGNTIADAVTAGLSKLGGWAGSLTGISGSASGSLVTKDALYRAGELGLNEAIIPLERPSIMQKVGQAIARSMPVEQMMQMHSAIGNQNAGISIAGPQIVQTEQDQARFVETITDGIYSGLAPLFASKNEANDQRTILYVGTLVANDAGLRELNKQMEVIKLQENRRGGN